MLKKIEFLFYNKKNCKPFYMLLNKTNELPYYEPLTVVPVPLSCSETKLPRLGDKKRPVTFGTIISDLKTWAALDEPLFSTLTICLSRMCTSKDSEEMIIGSDPKIRYLNRYKIHEHAKELFVKGLFWQSKKTLVELYTLVFPNFLDFEVVDGEDIN